MKNKITITINVSGESKTDNLIVSKYFTHILRLLGFDVSNKEYPVNGDESKTFLLAKHMDKLIKRNVPITMETYNERSGDLLVDKMLDKMYPKKDQFSEVFPEDKPTSVPIKKKKSRSSEMTPEEIADFEEFFTKK